MSWLEQHLEEFVEPVLHEYDDRMNQGRYTTDQLMQNITPLGYFQPEELTVMKNVWRSIKKQAKGQTIFLPGRDVWLFEVLARRENYPTVFMPECSRQTVQHIAKMRPELSELFLFDTGFAGSIPKNMKSKSWSLLSAEDFSGKKQIFPRLSLSRQFALKIENTPKYWESGRMVGSTYTYASTGTITMNWNNTHGVFTVFPQQSSNTNTNSQPDEILQPFSDITEFIRAVKLTVEVYTNSSPKFIHQHKPIRKEVAHKW